MNVKNCFLIIAISCCFCGCIQGDAPKQKDDAMLLRMQNVEGYLGKGYRVHVAKNQGLYHMILSGVKSRKNEREILSIIEKKTSSLSKRESIAKINIA